MPVRRSYDVTNPEGGGVDGSDGSDKYRLWLFWLILFLVLCGAVVAASVLTSKQNNPVSAGVTKNQHQRSGAYTNGEIISRPIMAANKTKMTSSSEPVSSETLDINRNVKYSSLETTVAEINRIVNEATENSIKSTWLTTESSKPTKVTSTTLESLETSVDLGHGIRTTPYLMNFSSPSSNNLPSTEMTLDVTESFPPSSTVLLSTETTPVVRSTETMPVVASTETTPIVASTETTPVVASTETTPVVASTETTPVGASTETTPVVASTETTPVVASTETTPVVASTDTTPVVASTETTPVVASTETTPVVTSTETSPVIASTEMTPVVASTETTPVVASTETTPVVASTETTPVGASTETTPVVASTETTPVVASTETTPVVVSTETTPVVASTETTPVVASTETTPVVASTETTPVVASTETTPVVASTETTPVVASTEMTPVVASTETTPVVASTEMTPVVASTETTPVVASTETTPNGAESSSPTSSTLLVTVDHVRSEKRDIKRLRTTEEMMARYRDNSTKACDNFYEHACGKFTTNDTTLENYLEEQVTQRIFEEDEKVNETAQSKRFLQYYRSCLNYENTTKMSDRIKLAREEVKKMGDFREEEHSIKDFTTLISKLLQRNSALLFDVTPELYIEEIDEYKCKDVPKNPQFRLNLKPPVFGSNFFVNHTDTCYDAQASKLQEEGVYLKELRENYQSCTTMAQLKSVEHAITELGFGQYNNSIIDSVMHILEKVYAGPADEQNIRKDRMIESYSTYTRDYKTSNVLDWNRLLQTVAGNETSIELLMRYDSYNNYKALIDLNTDSKRRRRRDNYYDYDDPVDESETGPQQKKISLWNGVLGLYAHKIYNELVVPGRDEKYCKRITMQLLERDASSLYMSSFKDKQLNIMKSTVNKMFEELKTTLELGFKKSQWSTVYKDTLIANKIKNLTIETPDVSYYQEGHSLHPDNDTHHINLTGQFFEDTITLQKSYRKLMYAVLGQPPSDYEQIWTHFSLPYRTSGSVIHGLNKIIMPFGTLDWRATENANKTSSHHLALATLGNQIAHEIARHFDSTGLRHTFNRKFKENDNLYACEEDHRLKDNFTKVMKDYRTFFVNGDDVAIQHKMALASTKRNIRYEILEASLDEIIAERIGLRLAYDTMLRIGSESADPREQSDVEHLQHEEQEFFLAYSDMYCTNEPLVSVYASLYEDDHLPSRVRVSVATSNNKVFTDAWKCAKDVKKRCSEIPDVFPHLESRQCEVKVPGGL